MWFCLAPELDRPSFNKTNRTMQTVRPLSRQLPALQVSSGCAMGEPSGVGEE